MNGYARGWRSENPDRQAAANRRKYESNRQTIREQQRTYYLDHREAISERKRKAYEANKDAHLERDRQYRASHPETIRGIRRRRRARKASALTIHFTVEQLAARMAYWGGRCWMCSVLADTIDHVIPLAVGGPHCLSNLRPACRSCNAAKGTKDWREAA